MECNDHKLIIVIAIVLSIFTSACAATTEREEPFTETEELHVAAASSLRFAFEEIGGIFEAEKDIRVVFQFGSSGNLAHQIASGAPVDLFASANKNFIDHLVDNGDILQESTALYAIGRVVLAVNIQSQLEILSLEDLISDEIDYISIANPSHAPYGLAAKEVLESKGLWSLVEDKLVYGETVSQALQFVQTGNAPVGIIALSYADVPEIEYFLVDEALHTPLEHTLGVVSHSQQQMLAMEFAEFITSLQGREIMEKHGFYLPE